MTESATQIELSNSQHLARAQNALSDTLDNYLLLEEANDPFLFKASAENLRDVIDRCNHVLQEIEGKNSTEGFLVKVKVYFDLDSDQINDAFTNLATGEFHDFSEVYLQMEVVEYINAVNEEAAKQQAIKLVRESMIVEKTIRHIEAQVILDDETKTHLGSEETQKLKIDVEIKIIFEDNNVLWNTLQEYSKGNPDGLIPELSVEMIKSFEVNSEEEALNAGKDYGWDFYNGNIIENVETKIRRIENV